MKTFMLCSYIVAIISWLGVFFNFFKQYSNCKKLNIEIPDLLLPFMVASLAFAFDSLYFGIMRIDEYIFDIGIHDAMNIPDLYALPKAIVAFSGLFILIKLNQKGK